MMDFGDKEFEIRYARQIAVPEIGKTGQEKLKQSKVLIIGCGALGSMVAMQLAGAGVGTIGIADFDNIDVSNLQRQFFFTENEVGESKVENLCKKIKSLNSHVKVVAYSSLISKNKANELFELYDFIVDATDNPDSKKMIGEISLKYGKGCCVAGVRNFEGQVLTLCPGDYRFEEYFGAQVADGFLPCSLGGVMGPVAAFCASVQSMETIKYLTGSGSLLSGKLFLFNLLNNSFRIFSL